MAVSAEDIRILKEVEVGSNVLASVIVPAYNEEAGIGFVLDNVFQAVDSRCEVLVVDDGSADGTSLIASRFPCRIVRHVQNRGKGEAMMTGLRHAEGDYVIFIDADGTYPADQIPILLDKLAAADMVVGARTGEEVHIPRARRPAAWMLRALARRVAEKPIPDLNSGLRCFRRECVGQYFPILSDQFSFTTTVTLAYLADDYRVVYHPINYYQRTGKSKIVPWHFFDFISIILRISLMFNPLKVFVPLAFFFGGLGALKTIYDIAAAFARYPDPIKGLFIEPVLSTSAVLLLFIGVQLLMIGMMADGVIRRIRQSNRSQAPSHGAYSVEITRPEAEKD